MCLALKWNSLFLYTEVSPLLGRLAAAAAADACCRYCCYCGYCCSCFATICCSCSFCCFLLLLLLLFCCCCSLLPARELRVPHQIDICIWWLVGKMQGATLRPFDPSAILTRNPIVKSILKRVKVLLFSRMHTFPPRLPFHTLKSSICAGQFIPSTAFPFLWSSLPDRNSTREYSPPPPIHPSLPTPPLRPGTK